MPSKEERIRLVIEAQDKATRELNSAKGALQGLGTAAQMLKGALGAAGIGSLIAMGRQVATVATEYARLGAQVQMVSAGFQELAGAGSTQMLERLRSAARGTIDDYSLMLSANRAMMLQVTDDAGGMVKLMEVAMRRGQAMGLSTQQAFDDIVTGIGRASPLILDNLGIVVNAEETYAAYAKSIGVAKDKLSELQKKQALAARVMAEATGEIPDLGDAASPATLDAAMKNLRAEIGLAMGGWQALMREIAEGAQETTERLRGAREARVAIDEDYYRQAAQDYIDRQGLSHYIYDDAFDAAITNMINKVAEGEMAAADARAELDALFGLMPLWAQEMASSNAALAEQRQYIDEMGTSAGRAAYALWHLSDAEKMLAGTRPDWNSGTDMYGGYSSDVPALTEEHYANNRKKFLESIGWVDPATARSTLDAAKAEAERQAQEWQSFVSGLLQPTQVTAADMAATEMGVYQDKWDEAVRRFRMAETGHNAYEIEQYEKQFYGGQMLDMVDWDALERTAREELTYKAGRENLLQTAMQKMAEAGVGLEKSEVANLLGLPADYATVGEERAHDLVVGITRADIGKSVVDALVQQFNEKVAVVQQAGHDIGEALGGGVVDGLVGAQLFSALLAAMAGSTLEARP